MTDVIRHQGVIDSIEGAHLKVKILQTSACASCKALDMCKSSESKEHLIDVYDYSSSSYSVGDEVTIEGATSYGVQAVLIAYVYPFIFLFIATFATYYALDGNELVAASAGLGILVPYYLIIYMMRDKLTKKFSFTIIKNQ